MISPFCMTITSSCESFTRQRLQEEGADDGEDAGVDADAEGEREDRDGGEPGLLANAAECLAEIVEHGSSSRA